MERQSDGTYIRKGPWSAEEDEVLVKYVKKYGPKGWSSIRSMGRLARTGKSCRLRWVNKLRPNLKTGCKFSAEEERVVIELQAQFGNKWAKIATHLQGRTDNDVKNFWSARRKRLERILQTPTCKEKDPGLHAMLMPMPMMEVPPCNYIPLEQAGWSSSHEDQLKRPSSSANSEESGMLALPDVIMPDFLNSGTGIQMIPSDEDCPVSLLPLLQLDLPVLPECQDLAPHPIDFNFMSIFKHQEASESQSKANLLTRFPSTGNTPERFFHEFPTDVFDFLGPLPNSSEW